MTSNEAKWQLYQSSSNLVFGSKPLVRIMPFIHNDGKVEAGWCLVMPDGIANPVIGPVHKTEIAQLGRVWWEYYFKHKSLY